MPPRNRRAAAARAAKGITRSLPPVVSDEPDMDNSAETSDVEMVDEPAIESKNDDDDDSEHSGKDSPDEAEDEDEEDDGSAQPSRSASPVQKVVQEQLPRRPGRPRKHPIDESKEPSTPRRGRGGWRGGRGGGRGGRGGKAKGGGASAAQRPTDKDGNPLDIEDDEVVLPDDPQGETKVDKLGNLKGGREYRVRTFTVLGKGDRLYMLSTEPARCMGFRDSYLFFQKHKLLYKIIIDDEMKHDLIERDLIPHSYKGRTIGVCTARSVYREFGARIIIGGKKIIDDYDVTAAKERGDVEGEIASPDDILPPPGEPYDRNRYVAWHGASAVYHLQAPNMPVQAVEVRKRVPFNDQNWMLESALEAARFNRIIAERRRQAMDGVYDIQTNIFHYPQHTQPTHARWEYVLNDAPLSHKAITNSTSATSKSSVLPELDPVYGRNFLITDTIYETAPHSNLPAPDKPLFTDYQELSSASWRPGPLSAIPADVLELLPEENRIAFEKAVAEEKSWTNKWKSEEDDGMRSVGKFRSYQWN